MNEVVDWLEQHEDLLARLATESEMDAGVVRLLAALVLTDHSEEEIYAEAQARLVSLDGQRSPLAQAPLVMERIRQAAAEG